uniref:Uncharacterized protein n=1 Tax=Amphiprion ocellaris TaxID=80972 RepID=A0AAQ5Y446_AMPOC
ENRQPQTWNQVHLLHSKCIVLTVNHGGGSLMIWGCIRTKGQGDMAFLYGTLNAANLNGSFEDTLSDLLRKQRKRWTIFSSIFQVPRYTGDV